MFLNKYSEYHSVKFTDSSGVDLGTYAVKDGVSNDTVFTADATTLVVKAEDSKLQADVNSAQTLVTALTDGTDKTDLQKRLTAVQALINATSSSIGTVTLRRSDNTSFTGGTKVETPVANTQIVSQLSTGIGTDIVPEVTQQFKNSDGSFDNVTVLKKNGEYLGTVIISGQNLPTKSIELGYNASTDENVYKFVPELSKYVKLTDGYNLNDSSITLTPAQYGTYLVTKSTLDTGFLLNQGWNTINNHEYKLEGTELVKGWISENGNWLYTDKILGVKATDWTLIDSKWYSLGSDGIMKTGWLKNNATWYYLNSDGSMKTGWHNDAGKWHYLNANGSMAVSTTIDGYYVDENGDLI